MPKSARNTTKLILPFTNEWAVVWGGDTKELNYHVESEAQKTNFYNQSIRLQNRQRKRPRFPAAFSNHPQLNDLYMRRVKIRFVCFVKILHRFIVFSHQFIYGFWFLFGEPVYQLVEDGIDHRYYNQR